MIELFKSICRILFHIGIVAGGIYALVKFIKLIYALVIGLRGTKYERDYSEIIRDLIKENIRIRPRESIVGKAIIDEGRGGLNTKIRKGFYIKLKHMDLDPILISEFSRESEKIAYILKQAVRETLYTELLPEKFLQTLIVYIAYKFAHKEKRIGDSVEWVLREELSRLKYFDYMLKLDSADWEAHIVLNPIPRKKPLLEHNLLPMVGIQTEIYKKEKLKGGNVLAYQKQWHQFFAKWIDRISKDKVRIMWIGEFTAREYLMYLEKNDTFTSFEFFIFGARDANIDKLDYFVRRLTEKYTDYEFNISSIEGKWWYRSMERDWKWYFCQKLPKKQKGESDKSKENRIGVEKGR